MTLFQRVRRLIIGRPKDVKEPGILHKVSLMAILAWVGLGADGLSSSAYGPEEAFRALGSHTGLAVFLALAVGLTIFIISYGYSRIIEQFPAGGGGYVVSTKVLGPSVGVVSGAALLVDYVLTIAISIASGADAAFSFLPPEAHGYKVALALSGIAVLAILNLRGVKESVVVISPVFAAFVVTHVVVIVAALAGHIAELPAVTREVSADVRSSFQTLGAVGALHLLVRAYSLGGGTFTGIEAVSNGVPIMREPRVETAKRTMVYMAASLAFMASGIVVCYLLMRVTPESGKTMNAVLIEEVVGSWSIGGLAVGKGLVILTLLSEAGLLLIAAQAGFVDGPRVMANMATDSWLPHWFAALSERLTMRNGVMLMAFAAAAAVLYTGGTVSHLVVMYSINVFVTFSLSNIAMVIYWVRHPGEDPDWRRHVAAHVLASVLCVTILGFTTYEKFSEGGWITVMITMVVVALCFLVRRHYRLVGAAIRAMDVASPGPELRPAPPDEPEATDAVAIVFVGGYSALGRRTLTSLLQMFPGHFQAAAFVSIAVVDSGVFKGVHEIAALEERTRRDLERYRSFAGSLGLRSMSVTGTGAEIAVEAEKLVTELVARFPRSTVVGGQLIFEEDTLWNRLLHNETAFLIQRRLQRTGIPMIVLPEHIVTVRQGLSLAQLSVRNR